VAALKAVPGIEQVTLTTNGVALAQHASALRKAGLDAVNISLDTLDPATFRQITGSDALGQVLTGLDTALEQGLSVKVNAVLQRDVNENHWPDLLELARSRKLDVRFIEMMPIGYGRGFQSISNDLLREQIEATYGPLKPDNTVHGNGPAVYWRIPGFWGSVGFISAIHGKFCQSCNRVRLTSTGFLKGCLCYETGEDLRAPLRQGDLEEVRRRFQHLVFNKPQAHCFEALGQVTERREMSKIGG
jgi:cyclic pyranopterin phosphate synthase